MDQIKELFEILKSTPEMALYGLLIWCLYILLKLSSVVYAIKAVIQLAINKWHNVQLSKIELEKTKENTENKILLIDDRENIVKEKEAISNEYSKLNKYHRETEDIAKLSKMFKDAKISDVTMHKFSILLDEMKSGTYIHNKDIDKAIDKLKS